MLPQNQLRAMSRALRNSSISAVTKLAMRAKQTRSTRLLISFKAVTILPSHLVVPGKKYLTLAEYAIYGAVVTPLIAWGREHGVATTRAKASSSHLGAHWNTDFMVAMACKHLELWPETAAEDMQAELLQCAQAFVAKQSVGIGHTQSNKNRTKADL